jgi:hypothetical protein
MGKAPERVCGVEEEMAPPARPHCTRKYIERGRVAFGRLENMQRKIENTKIFAKTVRSWRQLRRQLSCTINIDHLFSYWNRIHTT